MIRSSKIRFAVRMLVLFAVAAGTFGIGSQEARAQKGKPAPPPPGTIYYGTIDSQFWGMKSDGSGKFEVLPKEALLDLNRLPNGTTPVPWAYPSNQPSGERWWITTAITGTYDRMTNPSGNSFVTNSPHYDLVAVRRSHADPTQLDVVQLTDFFGIVDISIQSAFWSNDSNDAETSFAGFRAYDIRSTYDPETNSASRAGVPIVTAHLPVTVSEIAAGNFVPYDDTLTDEEIDDLLLPWILFTLQQGSTSSDGSLSLAIVSKQLMIVDAAVPDYNNPVQFLWDANGTQSPQSIFFPVWSPDGLTVAFSATGQYGTVSSGIGEGDIWTVPSNGSAPPKKVLASSKRGQTTKLYRIPAWSPDSKFLVVQEATASGTTVTNRAPVRIPAAGGTPLDLGVVDKSSMAFRWVPND